METVTSRSVAKREALEELESTQSRLLSEALDSKALASKLGTAKQRAAEVDEASRRKQAEREAAAQEAAARRAAALRAEAEAEDRARREAEERKLSEREVIARINEVLDGDAARFRDFQRHCVLLNRGQEDAPAFAAYFEATLGEGEAERLSSSFLPLVPSEEKRGELRAAFQQRRRQREAALDPVGAMFSDGDVGVGDGDGSGGGGTAPLDRSRHRVATGDVTGVDGAADEPPAVAAAVHPVRGEAAGQGKGPASWLMTSSMGSAPYQARVRVWGGRGWGGGWRLI